MLLSLALIAALRPRRRPLPVVIALATLTQLATHVALSLSTPGGCVPGGTPTAAADHGFGAPAMPAMPAMPDAMTATSPHSDVLPGRLSELLTPMVTGHVLAVVVTAVLLRYEESLARRLTDLGRSLRLACSPLLPRLPTLRTVALAAVWCPLAGRCAVLTDSVARRGPPAGR